MLGSGDALKILEDLGAISSKGHFVYTSGRHGTHYVNIDVLYQDEWQTNRLCRALAKRFKYDFADVVIGPEKGGDIIADMVARHLKEETGRNVVAANAKKGPEGSFSIDSQFVRIMADRNILVVDDVLTTGGSVRKVIALAQSLGGKVVGVGVLCNRGGVTKEDLDTYKLATLVHLPLESWAKEECALCAAGIPINPTPGK